MPYSLGLWWEELEGVVRGIVREFSDLIVQPPSTTGPRVDHVCQSSSSDRLRGLRALYSDREFALDDGIGALPSIHT